MGKAPGRKKKNPRGRSRVKKGGGPDWQLQQGFDPNVHIAKLPRGNGNWQRHILWTADWHWDNPKCDRDKLARTLDYARTLRAGVIVIGDLFCAMQGRYDKRANKNDLRPEHQVGDYFDALVGTAADWLEPWLENLVLIGVGNHECHDDQTEVLTEAGWQKFSEYTTGLRVATAHPVTQEIEWHVPSRRQAYYYNGEMLHWHGRGYDICVTPNHRMVYQPQKMTEWWVRDAERLSNTKSPMASMGVPFAASSGRPDYPVDDDWLRLVGWIISDGHLSKSSDTVCLFQREEKSHFIRDLLGRLGLEFSEHSRERKTTEICGVALKEKPKVSVDFRLKIASSRRVRRYIRKKYELPGWLWKISDRQCEVLLDSLILGDGTRPKSGLGKSTKVASACCLYGIKALLDQVQALLVTHGWKAHLTQYRTGHWRLNINNKKVGTISRAAESVPYSGVVYCMTVPNGTLLTRRNGKTIISGNSSVYQRCETDLITRLTQTLRFRGSTVKSGGYTGWVRLQGTYSDSNRSQLTCFYNHGTGGGGPVSKGLIEFARMREQFVADAYVLGHIHRSVSDTSIVQWLNKFHKVENRKVHCVRCGTFKDDYGTGFAGFPVEKGHGPRPLSAQLQTLTFRGERLFQEWREVDV